MTRVTFTTRIAELILYANQNGIEVLIDWVKRDAKTQHRMFEAKLSKCDGYKKLSEHQTGTAADLYVVKNNELSWDEDKYNFLHDYWEELGGGKRIKWDLGHFEE